MRRNLARTARRSSRPQVRLEERKKNESPELGEAVNDLRVMRGPGWDHGQEDGGPDGRGNIIRIKRDDHKREDCSVPRASRFWSVHGVLGASL